MEQVRVGMISERDGDIWERTPLCKKSGKEYRKDLTVLFAQLFLTLIEFLVRVSSFQIFADTQHECCPAIRTASSIPLPASLRKSICRCSLAPVRQSASAAVVRHVSSSCHSCFTPPSMKFGRRRRGGHQQ